MEQDLAIMMADLSGYTALTETHGAASAADLIDRYVEIVKDCLVGESELHERTGDEVMIVSRSADNLLATAAMIVRHCSGEHQFLQLHGGLHFGTVLKRNTSFFGTAINITSRIAAAAETGQFWCSGEFVHELTTPAPATLQSRGRFEFRNVSEGVELFEIGFEEKGDYYIDPVCRMLIVDKSKAITHPSITDLFFCSPGCAEKYLSRQ